MQESLKAYWEKLLESVQDSGNHGNRVLRALGSTAEGVRASVNPETRELELLIEVPANWKETAPDLPKWRGMGFEIISLSLRPRVENHQLVLSLRDQQQESVFLAYCADLVSNMEGITAAEERVLRVNDSIARWGRFFQKCGSDGLKIEQQAGLFGELIWFEQMIDCGLGLEKVVQSWKGCEGNFHDYDFEGKVVEVKTSMTKEPQQIIINNERQLDERRLLSLHLFFVALRKTEGGGATLHMKVEQIREKISHSPSVRLRFNDCLINSGYLDNDARLYKSHFVVKEELLFEVKNEFPRIVDTHDGIGSLEYGVLISSCRSFDVKISDYLDSLGGLHSDRTVIERVC